MSNLSKERFLKILKETQDRESKEPPNPSNYETIAREFERMMLGAVTRGEAVVCFPLSINAFSDESGPIQVEWVARLINQITINPRTFEGVLIDETLQLVETLIDLDYTIEFSRSNEETALFGAQLEISLI